MKKSFRNNIIKIIVKLFYSINNRISYLLISGIGIYIMMVILLFVMNNLILNLIFLVFQLFFIYVYNRYLSILLNRISNNIMFYIINFCVETIYYFAILISLLNIFNTLNITNNLLSSIIAISCFILLSYINDIVEKITKQNIPSSRVYFYSVVCLFLFVYTYAEPLNFKPGLDNVLFDSMSKFIAFLLVVENMTDLIIKKYKGNKNTFNKKEYLSQVNHGKDFYSLAPTDNVDDDHVYSQAIQYSLDDYSIKNIALTGQYGAGKSSVILSFFKKHPGYRHLNISLASFIDESDENKTKSNVIERSILQQMFYKVKHNKLPASRFIRLKKISSSNVMVNVILLFMSIGYLILTIYPNIWDIFFINKNILEQKRINNDLFWFFLISSLIFLIFSINKLIVYLKNNIKISKLGIKNTEIELNSQDDNSIFNKHLDEILYFFECTDYKVIVFEDLDRFENVSIFTKLREINLLINNSDNINRKISFIYLLKDDMFKDEEEKINRTKFFDFIIPIIQISTTTNSGELLLKMFNENPNVLSPSVKVVKELTLYIWDMRTLKNIFNEYVIYSKKILDDKLNKDKLFSMIVYKNIYPSDYANLLIDKGTIYKIFNKKRDYVKDLVLKYKEIILDIKLEKEKIISEISSIPRELLATYILKLYDYLGDQYQFLVDNRLINNIWTYLNEENLDTLKKARTIIRRHKNIYNNSDPISYIDIITGFGDKENYYDVKKRLENRNENKINELNKEIKEKKEIIISLEKSSLKKILEKDNKLLEDEISIDNKELMIYLLKSGYIDETYQDYITYFHEGTISKNDKLFAKSVKDREIKFDFDFRLKNCDEIYSILELKDFEHPVILNYDFIDFLSKNININEIAYSKVIKLLSNKSEISRDFIDKYLEVTNYKSIFINELCSEWTNIWEYITLSSNFSDEKVEKIFLDIVNYLKIETIRKINVNDIFKEYIETKSDFLSFPFIDDVKTKDVIKDLDIKFKNLEIDDVDNDLINFIYENNNYDLNPKVIKTILEMKIKYTDDMRITFRNANYFHIMNSECNSLIAYIQNNINSYVENVILGMVTNTKEPHHSLIVLYNNEELKKDLKEKLIEKMDTVISNLESIESKELWSILIQHNKVDINWHNITLYFSVNKTFDMVLTECLNKEENYKKLSIKKLNHLNIFDEKFYKEFALQLIKNKELNEFAYSLLIKSLPWRYNSINLDEISYEKLKLLIDNNKLLLTTDNFLNLKNINNNLHVNLLENNIENYIGNIELYILELKDYNSLLRSRKVTLDHKINIIEKAYLDNIIQVNDFEEVFNFKIDESEVLKYISRFSIYEIKIYWFISKIKYLSHKSIEKALKNYFPEYSKLTNYNTHPTISKNDTNEELLNELEISNYISSFKDIGEMYRVYFRKKKSLVKS